MPDINSQENIISPTEFSPNKKTKQTLLFMVIAFVVLALIITVGVQGYIIAKQNRLDKNSSIAEKLKNANTAQNIAEITPTVVSTVIPTANTINFINVKSLPLGDGKYSSVLPKNGYIYVCNSTFNEKGGAGTDGPWIKDDHWDSTEKVSVSGDIKWPSAKITIDKTSDKRLISTNDLPVIHNTGKFPIQTTDPAYKFDRNPNSISAQSENISIVLNPVLESKPGCIQGTVGVMLSGVLLFDGLDAGGRDAVAHEVQDSCDGHPEKTGSYHYHSLSKCIKDGHSDKLIGYAWDGFGIYGSLDKNGKELSTKDLDECHGLTSEVEWEGKIVNKYHYVMTKDYPYSVGCFKGSSIYRPLPPAGSNQLKGPPPQM